MNLENIIFPILEGNKKGIAFDSNYINLGQIQKINYPNLKYVEEGLKAIECEGEIKRNLHFVQFIDIPDNLIISIRDTIKEIIESKNMDAKSAIDEIVNYFRKLKFTKDIKTELIGDIGEAIFILKSFEKGMDFNKYMRMYDDNLYDFNINDKCIEIKTTSLEKNEFTITNEQINQIKDKKVVICKFKRIPGKVSILELYDLIEKYSSLNDLLIEKRNKWSNIENDYKDQGNLNDILKEYTVDLENVKLLIFNDNLFPEINVNDYKACKKISFYMDCSDSNTSDFEQLNKWYKEVINKD